jgi:nucleoid-associated protein YgaU
MQNHDIERTEMTMDDEKVTETERKSSAKPWILTGLVAMAGAGLVYFATQGVPDVAVVPAQQVAVAPPEAPAPKPVAKIDVEPKQDVPSFDTVRVEPDGNTVIAGRAAPGAEVIVKLNGKNIGTATANQAGEFVLVPDENIPEGTASISLSVQKDGKEIVSEQQVAVIVKPKALSEAIVAIVTPDAPTKLVPSTKASSKPSDVVKLDTIDYDADGNILFSGRASPNSVIRLYVDETLLGDVKTNAAGSWLFNSSPRVAAGNHKLRADELNAAGTVVSRVELPFFREDAKQVADIQQGTATDVNGGTKFGSGPDRIVIQPGNSLWKVSRVIYGKGTKYTLIFDANRDQIRNPNKIYPGQIFAAPKL